MKTLAQLNHVAYLVESASAASMLNQALGHTIGPAEKFEGEGTLEIYIGESFKTARILLMEPIKDGSYKDALNKRGPGLHHIGIDVENLEKYVVGLAGTGWFLHPKSLYTIRKSKTAYLARPGMPVIVEVMEVPTISVKPHFISAFELPFNENQMKMIGSLAIPQLIKSVDEKYWLTCDAKRYEAAQLFGAGSGFPKL